MQKPLNVSASSSPDRGAIAGDLYIKRGAADASSRCDLNTRYGKLDLQLELLKALRLKPGDFVLDVGCGSGQHLSEFAAAVGSEGNAIGVDFSPDAIAQVCERGQIGIVAQAGRLPLRSSCMDALTCNYAVYYFDDLAGVLQEWRRVLRNGGRVVLSGPGRGSNRELYDFHREATGSEPSDADKMALGYLADTAAALMRSTGFTHVELKELENPIHFPDANTFLDYWTSTSLFARTPGTNRKCGEEWFSRTGKRSFTVTKCISILSAIR